MEGESGKAENHWVWGCLGQSPIIQDMDVVMGFTSDVMSVARIGDAIRRAGRHAEFAATLPAMEKKLLLAGGDRAALLLVDLSCAGGDAIGAIKEGKIRGITVLAFGPHVEGELLKAAQVAGANRVLPRSRFFEQLADIVAS